MVSGAVSLNHLRALLKSVQKTVDSNSNSLASLNQKVDCLLAKEPTHSKEAALVVEENDQDLDELLRRALPIRSMEEFSALQENLKDNALLRKKLCSVLTLAAGKDVKDTCQNMMRKLMHDGLAQKFTYKGKLAGKARFAGTEISDALNTSVRTVVPGNISTDEKIKEHVSEWLTQAKFREQKRERRKKNQEVTPFLEINLGQYPTFDRAQMDQSAFQSMLDRITESVEEPLDLDER